MKKSVVDNRNRAEILSIIREKSPIFRAEISRLTGLSIPTVMKITNELIEKNIVFETGKGKSSGGKPPQLLEFNPRVKCIIGIEIGEDYIEAIITDLSATILDRKKVFFGLKVTPEELIEELIACINYLIDHTAIDREKILGIGIGMHGLINREEDNIIFATEWNWRNVDIVTPIKKAFQIDVIIDNSCRAYAMAEKWYGFGKNIDNFVCIFLGYGVGCGFVFNGEIYSGSSGTAGEFGHMIVEQNGPPCACGNYGCLESLASSYAIVNRAKLLLGNGNKSDIIRLAGGDINNIDVFTVFKAAEEGDILAIDIINEAYEYLGIGIASLINLVDPELIILEGPLSQQVGGMLTKTITKAVERRKMRYAGKHTKIVVSELGDEASALGASCFFLKKFIENGGNV